MDITVEYLKILVFILGYNLYGCVNIVIDKKKKKKRKNHKIMGA